MRVLILFLLFSGLQCSSKKIPKPEKKKIKLEINILGEIQDDKLEEISGIAPGGKGLFYAINDSGNGANVFQINSNGEISKKFKLDDVKNKDFEDLSLGPCPHKAVEDCLFVADIGNNKFKKGKIRIHIIELSQFKNHIKEKKPKITPINTIKLKFPEEFNREAFSMSYQNARAYIFTKEMRGQKGKFTDIFEIDLQTEKISNLGTKLVDQRITGSDISKDSSRLALISDKFVYLYELKNKKVADIINLTPMRFKIPENFGRQFESICFDENNDLIIVSEKDSSKKQKILKLPWPQTE